MNRRACLATLVVTLALASSVDAAVLQVSGGILTGATGVDVNGTLYDVEFVDDTCGAVFTGCDSTSDFTFTSDADAKAASNSLLGEVFVDGPEGQFDSLSFLTFGCPGDPGNPEFCVAVTPFATNAGRGVVTWAAANFSDPFSDGVFMQEHSRLAAGLFRWPVHRVYVGSVDARCGGSGPRARLAVHARPRRDRRAALAATQDVVTISAVNAPSASKASMKRLLIVKLRLR